MFLIKSPNDLDITLESYRSSGMKIGFVATMGALHEGHISLIERSKLDNNMTVCSIFVNPRQFNDPKDLEKYPRPIEKDIEILTNAQTDILFLPGDQDIYPTNYYEPSIDLDGLDSLLEGTMRPGHFKGVALVVKRLFDCVKPDRAYFGQKDYQQTLVIKQLVKQFNIPTQILIGDIIREENGLAMSSRNNRLPSDKRVEASFIYNALLKMKEELKTLSIPDAIDNAKSDILQHADARIEYLVVADPENLSIMNIMTPGRPALILIVVNYGGVRLLDNMFV